MRATGIVRRIDELGRVVIPKELRRTMKIREGEELEVMSAEDNTLVLKKYSAVKESEALASYYVSAIYKSTGYTALITDRDKIVAADGALKHYKSGDSISFRTEKAITERKTLILNRGDVFSISGENEEVLRFCIIAPLVTYGDAHGAVILLSNTHELTDTAIKIAETAADFLSTQLA